MSDVISSICNQYLDTHLLVLSKQRCLDMGLNFASVVGISGSRRGVSSQCGGTSGETAREMSKVISENKSIKNKEMLTISATYLSDAALLMSPVSRAQLIR